MIQIRRHGDHSKIFITSWCKFPK